MKFIFKQGDIITISGSDGFLENMGDVLDKKILEINNDGYYYIEELKFDSKRFINKDYLEMMYELKKSGNNSIKKI